MSFDIREHNLPLPKGWSYKKISDIAKVNANTIRKKDAPDEIYYIDISSVSNGFFEPPKHMLYADAPSRAKRIVKKNDFIISTVRPNLKQYVFLDEVHENWIASTGFAVVTAIEAGTEWYLYSVITSELFNEHLVRVADGGAYPAFNPKEIEDAVIFWPDEDSLRVINDLAFNLNTKQKNNTQTNQALEQIAQALFKSWFVDFGPVKAKIETLAQGGSAADAELAAMGAISAKTLDELNGLKASNSEAFNKLAQTAALFPDAMQDSELGEIPEGWEVKKLSEICQVINGRAYKNTEFKTEGTPIVRIQNLSNGGKTVYSDLELPPEKYIDREDFIYAWSATFGPHIWRGPKSIYHYHIWKMEVDESVISRYFLYLSMFRKTEAMKNAGTGSIFTHLTKKIMESQHVLIGDHAINKKFSDIIVPIFDQISSLKNESTHLADIRDALLPKLLTGDGLTSEVANV